MSYDADGNWIDDEVPDASDGQQTLNGVIPWPTTGEVPPAPTTPTDQYRGGELEDLGNGTGIDPRNGAIIDLRPGSPTKGQRIDSRPDIAATINEGRARQALARQTQDNADRTRADQLTKDANDLAQRNWPSHNASKKVIPRLLSRPGTPRYPLGGVGQFCSAV
jgi:hypothetical protein